MASVDFIRFNQFGSLETDDELLMFAATAADISKWAGIPRKGWRIRMLYQRWLTEVREGELKEFWDAAGMPKTGERFILGPTAIIIGIQDQPTIVGNKLVLDHAPAIDFADNPVANLAKLAEIVRPRVLRRLSKAQVKIHEEFETAPKEPLPPTSHDYVFEFAFQLTQMIHDPQWFVYTNAIEPEELRGLNVALEAISRPALVIDGQHRLWGAANAAIPITLPVVAIPNASWMEQIYQFVVINEKAQRVETSLLTDIFGSSLSQTEQAGLRNRLGRANVNVEPRIAATIANRDPSSPFFNLVRVRLEGNAPSGIQPFITDLTIRLLIEGGARGTRGWRADDEFYETYVQPTFPNRAEWDSWAGGKWRDYWFAFWECIGEFYNDQAAQLKKKPLWTSDEQTNLTKAVGLRTLQTLFVTKAVDRIGKVRAIEDVLREELGEDLAAEHIKKRVQSLALPASVAAFKTQVTEWFLEKGVPVRVFTKPWKKSLDDDAGREDLWNELERAFDLTQKGQRYHARASIFDATREDDE
ncbi:MAG: hypothetical protein JWP01_2528 [Myxococcales bacterium]|nr:hypothetical protein [Myxococcales bacterium]